MILGSAVEAVDRAVGHLEALAAGDTSCRILDEIRDLMLRVDRGAATLGDVDRLIGYLAVVGELMAPTPHEFIIYFSESRMAELCINMFLSLRRGHMDLDAVRNNSLQLLRELYKSHTATHISLVSSPPLWLPFTAARLMLSGLGSLQLTHNVFSLCRGLERDEHRVTIIIYAFHRRLVFAELAATLNHGPHESFLEFRSNSLAFPNR